MHCTSPEAEAGGRAGRAVARPHGAGPGARPGDKRAQLCPGGALRARLPGGGSSRARLRAPGSAPRALHGLDGASQAQAGRALRSPRAGTGAQGWGKPFLLRSPHGFSKPQANTNLQKKKKKKSPRSNNAVYPLPPKGVCDLLLEGEIQRFPVAARAAPGPASPPSRPGAPSPRPVSCKTRGRDLSSVAEPPSADWPERTHLLPDKPPSHGWLSINLFKKVSGVVKAERESVCVCKRG